MTDQELAEIKEFCIKSDKSLATVNFDGDMWKVIAYCADEKTANMLATIEDYIPALLTEIERLKAELEEANKRTEYVSSMQSQGFNW